MYCRISECSFPRPQKPVVSQWFLMKSWTRSWTTFPSYRTWMRSYWKIYRPGWPNGKDRVEDRGGSQIISIYFIINGPQGQQEGSHDLERCTFCGWRTEWRRVCVVRKLIIFVLFRICSPWGALGRGSKNVGSGSLHC